ncbi:MAG: DUF1036 domain-containing protein [Alphaproteobacteria bacterium]|nr:DUF1036 domain-containing protein [Alphaproteobacteria bacterium]
MAFAPVAAPPAHATLDHPQICNGTNVVVSVAVAWWGNDNAGVHSRGWYNIEPGQCRSLYPEDSLTGDRYYFAYSQFDPAHPELSRNWGSGPAGQGWCVGVNGDSGRAFAFDDVQDVIDTCQPGAIRRGFLNIPTTGDPTGITDAGDDGDVTLTWDNGRYGSLTW